VLFFDIVRKIELLPEIDHSNYNINIIINYIKLFYVYEAIGKGEKWAEH
jgi:hypothetical protein